MSALAGLRVLVTRPRDQAAPLVDALARAGAVPIVLPAITIEPVEDLQALDQALDRIRAGGWLVFTSANAVPAVAMRLAARGARLPAAVKVAAVGPATARAAGRYGFTVHAVPVTHLGSAIAATLGDVAGRRVLLPCADIAREETTDALRAAGAVVDRVVVYRTVAAERDAATLADLERGVDVVTFTAPSTVRQLLEHVTPRVRQLIGESVIACIGPTTAAAARDAGLDVAVRPRTHTVEALVAALEQYFAAFSVTL